MSENTMQKAAIENPQGQMVEVEDDDEISLLDLAIVLAKFKKLILGLPVLVGALTVGATLLMTPIFTATTAILPPQQSQSTASALLGQLGGLAGIAGAAAVSARAASGAMTSSIRASIRARMLFPLSSRLSSRRSPSERRSLDGAPPPGAVRDPPPSCRYSRRSGCRPRSPRRGWRRAHTGCPR